MHQANSGGTCRDNCAGGLAGEEPPLLRISVSARSATVRLPKARVPAGAVINHGKRLIWDTLGSLRDDYAGRRDVQQARSLANDVAACVFTLRLLCSATFCGSSRALKSFLSLSSSSTATKLLTY